MPADFKNRWVDYIEQEFDCREQGFWFMNNGVKTYITGSHYMYFNGQVLMLDILISVKLIESIGFFGKRVRQMKDVLE
jgi:hypothetical protein